MHAPGRVGVTALGLAVHRQGSCMQTGKPSTCLPLPDTYCSFASQAPCTAHLAN